MSSTEPSNSRSWQEPEAAVGSDPHAHPDQTSGLSTPAEKNEPELNMASRSDEAEAVRRQVDHYFSGDNLAKDTFLLQQMKGRKNRPIPVQMIAKFQKMREYQPLAFVIKALKTSSMVNIVKHEGNDCIQRKEPFIMEQQQKASGTQSVRSWAKPNAASGFESYFTEGPLPPDVAAEESEIYNEDSTFEERMEHAIRAYITRRKFNSTVSNIFSKWMRFGGVDVQPHAHVANTVDPQELEGLTAKEKKLALAPKPYLSGEEMDTDGKPLWEVDFEGVSEAFLSSIVPEMFIFNRRDQYFELTNVMQNFLRYLQYHRVCPEYNTAINATIRICDIANRELPACETLQQNLPGAFNTAASTLFGGVFHDAFVGDQEWARGERSEGIDISHGLSGKSSKQLYMTGFVAFEKSKQGQQRPLDKKEIMGQRIASRESVVGLEVVEILPPTEDVIEMYTLMGAGFEPLGRLVCRTWRAPDFFDWDLPAHVSQASMGKQQDKTYTFLLEETLLQNCHVGIKLENARIITLEPSGIQILDGIPSHTRASFYQVLENELVLKWKEPRFITREEQKEREARLEEWKMAPTAERVGERSGGSGEGSEVGMDDEF